MVSRIESISVLESKLLIFDNGIFIFKVVAGEAFETTTNYWNGGYCVTLNNEFSFMIPKDFVIFLNFKYLILKVVFNTPGKH